MFKLTPIHSLLLAGAVAATGFVAAAPQDEVISLRDPGVINKERIVYWLKKNGAIEEHASQAVIEQALNNYLRNTASGHTKPMVVRVMEEKALKNHAKYNKSSKASMASTVKVLSVLIDFPDLPYDDNRLTPSDTDMYYSSYPVSHYQDLQFSTTGYTGPSGQNLMSGYQYYQAESGGSFSFTGETFGWVTADNNASYYGANDPDRNDNDIRPQDLIKEAVQKAVTANNIDLSEFDLEDPYDRDQDGNLDEPDGFIDHVMVYHSSVGEEAGGGVLGDDAIWAHRFFVNYTGNFNTMGFPIDYGTCSQNSTCIRLYGYTVQPLTAATGVVVHEFGHDLGLADEYDIGNNSAGSPVGSWSVMASGSWTGSPSGTVPTGFSPYARDYFQDKFGGNWITQTEINFADLNSTGVTQNLVEAVNHNGATANQIRVAMPVAQAEPYAGNFQYYSGQGDNLSNSMSFDLSVPSGTNIALEMKAHWNIEEDWDYAWVKVNGTPVAGNHTSPTNPYTGQYPEYDGVVNYISGASSEIAGAEGLESWVDLSFDLSAYAGQNVTVTFEYITDANTGSYGFAADEIALTVDGSTSYTDGAETAVATLSGFTRIGALQDFAAPTYYYVQLRSHNGVDAGLDSRSYTDGVVLWYRNDNYSDNRVGDHPGYGFIGVVDANQTLVGGQTSSQIRDAAFQLGGFDVFRDTDDYSQPGMPAAGLVLPVHGFEMQILTQANDNTTASVLLKANGLALSGGFNVAKDELSVTFTNTSFGGTAPYTYSWDFGDGNTSTAASPTHVYAAEGTYTVTLTVTDADTTVAEYSEDVTVAELLILPLAAFSQTITDLTVNFNNTSTSGRGALSYSWDFGDGNSSTATSPTHTYAAAGTYTVVLEVTDSVGSVDTSTKTITVTAPQTGGNGGGSSGGGGSLPPIVIALFGLVALRQRRR